MANNLYAIAIKKFLNGTLDWDTTTNIKAVLIDSADYTPDFALHDFYDDVPSAARIGTPQAIANRSVSNSGSDIICDGDDVTFTAVTGDSIEKVLIFHDTGVEGTSELIALLDLVVPAPTAIDITVRWAAGGIFKITV